MPTQETAIAALETLISPQLRIIFRPIACIDRLPDNFWIRQWKVMIISLEELTPQNPTYKNHLYATYKNYSYPDYLAIAWRMV